MPEARGTLKGHREDQRRESLVQVSIPDGWVSKATTLYRSVASSTKNTRLLIT